MNNNINFNNLTLIIPAKYESESLPEFLEELGYINSKILVILQNDDLKTIDCLKNFKNVKILYQKINGYGAAITEGLNACKTEYCCIINADGSMDPKYLREMLLNCYKNDFVFGSRYMKYAGSEDDTVITLIGNKVFTLLSNLLYRLDISDILYTYIMGKTKSFLSLDLSYKDFRICVEIPIKAKRNNLNYICLPSYERSRIAGKKKVNAFKDGFLILIAILSFLLKTKK